MVHLCTALSMSSVVMPGRTISPARSSTSAARRPAARMRSMPWGVGGGELEAMRWRGRVEGWSGHLCVLDLVVVAERRVALAHIWWARDARGNLQAWGDHALHQPRSVARQKIVNKEGGPDNIYINLLFIRYSCLPFRPAAGAPPPKRLRTTSAWARCETQAWDACRATIEAHKVDALISFKYCYACFTQLFLIQISCCWKMEDASSIVHGKVAEYATRCVTCYSFQR